MARITEEATVTLKEVVNNVDGARRLLLENAAILEEIAKWYRDTAKQINATL